MENQVTVEDTRAFQMKQCYVPVSFWKGYFWEERTLDRWEVRLGWKIGKIGFYKDPSLIYKERWELVHIPSGISMAHVLSFVQARSLAHMFMVHGVSDKTTYAEIKESPEWPAMQRVRDSWFRANH